jgi:hypothetical protein
VDLPLIVIIVNARQLLFFSGLPLQLLRLSRSSFLLAFSATFFFPSSFCFFTPLA